MLWKVRTYTIFNPYETEIRIHILQCYVCWLGFSFSHIHIRLHFFFLSLRCLKFHCIGIHCACILNSQQKNPISLMSSSATTRKAVFVGVFHPMPIYYMHCTHHQWKRFFPLYKDFMQKANETNSLDFRWVILRISSFPLKASMYRRLSEWVRETESEKRREGKKRNGYIPHLQCHEREFLFGFSCLCCICHDLYDMIATNF